MAEQSSNWTAGFERAWADDDGRLWGLKDGNLHSGLHGPRGKFNAVSYSLHDLLSDVREVPGNYPNFRELPCLPYTDADVDRLVELQWAAQVSAQRGDWSQGRADLREKLMEAWTVEARAFLSDYAQYKAARDGTVAGRQG